MSNVMYLRRTAFSLLEMIIATAILAASGMVLTSLLGLGAKFGNRAEERTLAITRAHSLLDQFLAQPTENEVGAELTGEFPGMPPYSFRLIIEELPANGSRTAMAQLLRRVTVEVLPAGSQRANQTIEPLCRISRLVRVHRLQGSGEVGATQEATSVSPSSAGSSFGGSTIGNVP
jgi:type II secretory pathway pseudopilin PulG